MNNPALYWHTLKYLKPIQLWYRLWFRLYKPTPKPIPTPVARKPSLLWTPCFRSSSMRDHATFEFLNRSITLQFPRDWTNEALPALWLYNLHYFDDLVAEGAAGRIQWHQELVARWIVENPATEGVGWESYPTSLRIVNWVKWYLGGNVEQAGILESIVQQASWLERRIEYHLQANHLWANGKALLVVGVLVDGLDGSRWLRKGEQLITEQLRSQVLVDGGHFERSPMYHAIVLEDVLDLLQLATIFPGMMSPSLVDEFEVKARAMLGWLAALTHPDIGIALFNDAALGIAPDYDSLQSYATAIGVDVELKPAYAVTKLSESGYVRVQNSNMVLLCDVGELGPDFQPGHGHADTLSCEVSLFGARFIVNSGIDRYEPSVERLHQRSTAAHSTLEVDGENSSEVWASFRVARRARPFALSVNETEEMASVSCSHDGYCRLPGTVVHNRTWELRENSLAITDKLTGNYDKAVARFFLHPAVDVVEVMKNGCKVRHCNQVVRVEILGGELEIEASNYYPEFGKSLENRCLVVQLKQPKCTSSFSWQTSILEANSGL